MNRNLLQQLNANRASLLEKLRLTFAVSVRKRESNRRLTGLSYDVLEDRLPLTTFVVNTAVDSMSNVADGYVSLREAIFAANTNAAFGDAPAGDQDGDTIQFDRAIHGATIKLTFGQLVISDDVLIQGGASGITISGEQQTRLFRIVSSERVGFGKLTLANGVGDRGGAMTIVGDGTTLLVSSTFIHNEAEHGGGAIFFKNGRLSANDSSFFENRAVGPGGRGGAIQQTAGYVFVRGGAMEGNSAIQSGGAIAISGGAFVAVDLSLGSTRAGNTAGVVADELFADGGGLHVGGGATATIHGGQVVGNVSSRSGGGLTVEANASLRVRSGTVITENLADYSGFRWDLDPGGGGGIYNNGGRLYVDGATIASNSAQGPDQDGAKSGAGGGILSWNGMTHLTRSIIHANSALIGGGGIAHSNGFLRVADCSVTNNTTSDRGGGILAASATVAIDRVSIDNNWAADQGGGIWVANSNIFLRNWTSVSFNTAAMGGGVYQINTEINSTTTLRATDTVFQGNVAKGYQNPHREGLGGAILMTHFSDPENRPLHRIHDSFFFANRAAKGGGIYLVTRLLLTDSHFAGNEATNEGADFYVDEAYGGELL